ncbi:hypothetical protein HX062_07020 [Myroides sp. DF42-4-2]|uniref:hypothetical protein n=1 Tax=unclassified Myroides TaxID=2642485 RepID=UPI0015FB2F46|nr:hypothetical protein [Myroides sp. NP-2]MDM1407411.1 hypothetical protein [Myroides sp. DF42-4-2]
MEILTSRINCPNCHTPVELELVQLLMGTKFSCSNCQSLISLSSDSQAVVKQAIQLYHTSIEKTKAK